jgi:hypothetical protein
MKKTASLPLVVMALSLIAAGALAADKPARVKYVAPDGFAGHKWGDLRSTFDRLPEQPIGVGAAYMLSVERQTAFSCVPAVAAPGAQISGAIGGCDFQATLLRLRSTFEGGGTYVLSEYTIEGQGFRFGDENDAVVLHPVVYQFCANWPGSTKKRAETPPNFDALNKFCGVRFLFESETREQLRKLPEDHVTNYDRVLERLLAKYGQPKGYLRRGRVLIETLEGESTGAGVRRTASDSGPAAMRASSCRSIPRPERAACCTRRLCCGSTRSPARTTASRATGSTNYCTPRIDQRAWRNVRL